MAEIILNVELRDRAGTGGSRETRRQGKVPGVLYGGNKAPVNIAVKGNEFRKALYTGKLLGHLVTLQHGDEKQSVIAKAVQFHPVTDEPMHFDLYRVGEHQLIKIEVPVHFKNHDISVGLKKGGTLEVIRHVVELACPADKIPEELVIDLASHDIGDTIRISEVKLPEGVRPAQDRDFVIANLKASAASQSNEGDTTTAEA
ncbi:MULTISPECIES: 50S ribosomal protein L25/general stress protein Ctc [Caulobacter]|jgi:large subunit ribosomal protein L25|uniref:Large ribosomal subunit protein bL25 n=1 Tax=Caulobacter rhizosphaerae TaxID=2010972 RepID=A0ABU1N3F9_9CAUL|nr:MULTISPECIES: 50S ribosomal protein L25/general stress protein Ctc [Caulobacter]KQZ27225.1 50S ribosomal protein L25 [Caulobacter sp. Root1472]MDR6532989.1 large subunit ribosomal protein L25 [Caulobacter rhizosphaerae]GGL34338.1 50S ribosomal protein L25 [Caulobacter rhizosphaerae]